MTNSRHFANYERKKWHIRSEPVESDLDIEFMQKEEQIERQKDEFFGEKEKRERAEPILDPDIEFMQKEEEIERQKDEYFEEKEKRERAELAKKCDNNEPQE